MPRSLVRRVLVAVTVVSAAVLGLPLAGTQSARAATLYGNDVSWPQCPVAQGGNGLPMPDPSTGFVVIGLTDGLPFTTNPCLASQVGWADTNSVPAHAYTMAAFPTAAQLTTYGGAGPWSTTTRAGRLSNVGYAEATYAAQRLAAAGFHPPVVWVDVEPRSAQPWPTATSTQRRENRYVVEGLMRGLRAAGYSYGLYSYLSGWQAITGSWWLPGVPVWATAGHLDYPNEALDRCTQPSFSGGRVYLSQWTDDVRDFDLTCGTYGFTPIAVPASTLSGSTADFNGSWDNDLLARVSANGDLRLYAGTGRGTLAAGVVVGSGWNAYSLLETVGDFDGDGAQDVLARQTATGTVWLYRGNGRGGWLGRVRVATGWSGYDVVVGTGDFSGDQRVDVLARERSTGVLWLQRGDGAGGWLAPVRFGSGWNAFSALVGPGDFNGDGTADLLARQASNGYLWLYPGDGAGGWRPRVRVGTGWSGYTLMSPGDLNGDRTPDVLARDRYGYLWLYPGNGAGGWLSRVRLGSGWNAFNALF